MYFIYFLKNKINNSYKIGYTSNIFKRINQIKISDVDNNINLYCLIIFNDKDKAKKAERYYHNIFKQYKINFLTYKEWFNLPNNFLEFIKENYYINYLQFKDIHNIDIILTFNDWLIFSDYELSDDIDELTLYLVEQKDEIFLHLLKEYSMFKKVTSKILDVTIREILCKI